MDAIYYDDASMIGPDPNVHAGPDMVSWDGNTVSLTGSTEIVGYSTITWSSDPAVGVSIADGDTLTPDVTIVLPSPDLATYELRLDIDGKYDLMKIDVYPDVCEATIAADRNDPTDLIGDDCFTNLADFTELAKTWLNDKNLATAEAKLTTVPPPPVQADVMTTTSAGDWNTASNWDTAVPSGTDSAVASDGHAMTVTAAASAYSGTLTMGNSSSINVSDSGDANAFIGTSNITMNDGTTLTWNLNANLNFPPITLLGDALFVTPFGASDWQIDHFEAITGPHTLTLDPFNGHEFFFDEANSFSELLLSGQADRYVVAGNAPGAFGTGNVTVENNSTSTDRSAVIEINADDVMDDNATLTLFGQGWANSNKGRYEYTVTRLVMNANDRIGGLIIDGVVQPFGDYSAGSGDWIDGPGTLTVKFPDPNRPSVDAGVDMVTWSGEPVPLVPTVVNNDTEIPQRDLSYLWTADPNTTDPNITIGFVPSNTVEAPTVTITNDVAAGGSNAYSINLTLTVTLPDTEAVEDAVVIYVYDDACKAAVDNGVEFDPGDVNEDCETTLDDLAIMALAWLADHSLTEAAVKP